MSSLFRVPADTGTAGASGSSAGSPLPQPSADGTSRVVGAGGPRLVTEALELIESLLHTGMNVQELSWALDIDRTTLFRAFRRELGTTPIRAIRAARLRRAKTLLRHSNATVSEVAGRAGFGDHRYFMRTFRSAEGMTPTQWRNRRRAARQQREREAVSSAT
jgi:transcriptional regulator GlxA family with amidase domain